MKLLSTDKLREVSITLIGTEPHLPCLYFAVDIIDNGFRGSDELVGVHLEDYQSFIAQLRECEKTRMGTATLSGLSPDAFMLTFEQHDGDAHFVLEYKLCRQSVAPFTTLTGGFDLNSDVFAQIVSDFANLITVADAEALLKGPLIGESTEIPSVTDLIGYVPEKLPKPLALALPHIFILLVLAVLILIVVKALLRSLHHI